MCVELIYFWHFPQSRSKRFYDFPSRPEFDPVANMFREGVLCCCTVLCWVVLCAAVVCCLLYFAVLCCVRVLCAAVLCCAALCAAANIVLLLCCAANIVRCAAGHKVGAGANWEETPQQFYPKPQNFYRKISPPVERKRRREGVRWKTYCFENSNGCLKGSLPAIDLSMDWRTHDWSLLDFKIIFTLLSLDLISGQFNDVVSLRSVANLKGFN